VFELKLGAFRKSLLCCWGRGPGTVASPDRSLPRVPRLLPFLLLRSRPRERNQQTRFCPIQTCDQISRGTSDRSVHRDALSPLPGASRLRLRRGRYSLVRQSSHSALHMVGGSISGLPPPTGSLVKRGQGTLDRGWRFYPPSLTAKYPQPSPLTECADSHERARSLAPPRICNEGLSR
jgi:hypothetical protein